MGLRAETFCGGGVAATRFASFCFGATLSLARVFGEVRLFPGAAIFNFRFVEILLATLAGCVADTEAWRATGVGFFAVRFGGVRTFLGLAAERTLEFCAAGFLALAVFVFARMVLRGEAGLLAVMAFLLFVPSFVRFM